MLIDLHCHSTASDGVFSPQELIHHALSRNITMLSLTDHDTIDGLAEARKYAHNKLDFVNGIELSCTWAKTTIHILGYAFANDCEPLIDKCNELHQLRWQRADKIAENLAKLGFKDALHGARNQQKLNSTNAPARPHFAKFLVEIGAVSSVQKAFDQYLASGKIGDVKQFWPHLADVMTLLKQSGALISLAHPYYYGFTHSKLLRLIIDFVQLGGHALEIVNGMQNPTQIMELDKLAHKFKLSVSFGSDFHYLDKWNDLGLYQNYHSAQKPLWQLFEANKLKL